MVSEIERQCGYALLAYGDAASALAAGDAERFWYSLQALLTAASCVCHLLWPLHAEPRTAREMRLALGVSDSSPLARLQVTWTLDMASRIHAWGLPGSGEEPLPSNFGPDGLMHIDPTTCARFFDSHDSVFIIYGVSYDLPAIMREIAALGPRAAGWAAGE